MNDAIQFHSRVGDDGILNVQVNLGSTEAKKEVVVTIEPLSANDEAQQGAAMPWPDFVERTYGSCAGLGLERHEQRDFEPREPIT
ncbi:MAG: hypothetical protein WD738_14090 [Pirellulales bacterium]